MSSYSVIELPLSTVSIRDLRETDLRALEWQGGSDLRGFYEDLWRGHDASEIQVLVADYNAFPIGLCVIHWPGKPTQPGVPDIQSLRVHPVFRGLSIGSQLIATAEALVRQSGHGRVGLSVGLKNPKAKRLYERHGYRTEGVPYCDVWFYTDARGQSVRVEEDVLDLVKDLNQT